MSYRTPDQWQNLIDTLGRGLTIAQVAKRLGVAYGYARVMLKGRYQFKRQSRTVNYAKCRLKPSRVNWALSNPVIARKYKVSRERVRQARALAGKPKVNGRK